MPLANLTAVANLALDLLGEPYLTDYATDTGTTADAVRLHLPQCVETVLEGHVWSFASRTDSLVVSGAGTTAATLTTGEGDAAIQWDAVAAGVAGNDITVRVSHELAAATTVEVDETAIAIFPAVRLLVNGDMTSDGTTPVAAQYLKFSGMFDGFPAWNQQGNVQVPGDMVYNAVGVWVFMVQTEGKLWISDADVSTPDMIPPGAYHETTNPHAWRPAGIGIGANTGEPVCAMVRPTAGEIAAAVNGTAAAAALLTASVPDGATGLEKIDPFTATHLAGGMSTPGGWATAWTLPADCLRLRTINTLDIDAPENRFEIQGRVLLLSSFYSTTSPPEITYISSAAPVTEWPAAFCDAVAFLLASRLAPKLAQSQELSAAMFQRHEIALGKARSKDARETRSKENHGPRALAARSGLVAARYQTHHRPPY